MRSMGCKCACGACGACGAVVVLCNFAVLWRICDAGSGCVKEGGGVRRWNTGAKMNVSQAS
jgi:hypothetical protein